MGEKKFLLLSMDDEKTKTIANAVNNKTCKKILEFLSDTDATETEISEKLDLPISSVHYNLQLLMKAKLVSWEKYHLSAKGKEVRHYSLANKFIIIAPKEEREGILDVLKKLYPAIFATFIGAFLVEFFNKSSKMNEEIFAKDALIENEMVRAVPMAVQNEAVNNSGFWFMSEPTLYFFLGCVFIIVVWGLCFFFDKKRKL